MIDRARKNPVIWISAPGGSGKTTLVASYLRAQGIVPLWYQIDSGDNDIASFFYYMGLAARSAAPRIRTSLPLFTSEYVGGLAAFTTNYFRDLFARLKRPGVVVFDNFQDVTAPHVHEALQQGFDQIPPKVNVIVVSREEPPSVYARSRAAGRLAVVGWEDLKLTRDESVAIAKLRQKKTSVRDTLNVIHERTGGWVAGLVLLTEQINTTTEEPMLHGGADQSIFDYFANEIFRHGSSTVQNFLLQTAFLPKFSAVMAQHLLGQSGGETVLRDLTRRNLFTVRRADGSYEYHPLFRAFLHSRVNATYDSERIRQLKQRSAQLLADAGDVETAVALLQHALDWPAAMGLVLAHASALRTQGRTVTLETWLRNFPETVRNENPWALYWLGVCRLPFAQAEARRHLEQAFALFEKQQESSPLYLTWSRIVDSYLIEINEYGPILEWIARYDTLQEGRYPPATKIENASVFTYVSGLMYSRFDHPNMSIYAERAERLFNEQKDKSHAIMRATTVISYHLWMGDSVKVGGLLEQLTPSGVPDSNPLAQISWYMWKALHAGGVGEADTALRAVTDGLALAERSGTHALDMQLISYGILSQVLVGDIATARSLLQKMAPLTRDGYIKQSLYSHYAAMVEIHEGNLTRSIEEGKRSVNLAKVGGLSQGIVGHSVGLAFAYAHQGNLDAATELLDEVRPGAVAMKSKFFESGLRLCEANVYRLRGEQALALRALDRALSLAAAGGFVISAYCPRETAAILYSMALDAGIQPDHVRATITKTRLSPSPSLSTEQWPWPIRIYTFGRFVVLKDDAPLVFTGRVHKKSLDLLRALIVYGGRDVSVSKLAQMLWPDTDGDMAEHTLETTLYRLRKLLGERCIVQKEGQLSLNLDYCWIDVRALERLFELADPTPSSHAYAARLLDLYRGSFLDGDDSPEVALRRERLYSKFVRTVERLGQKYEQEENYQAAVLWYKKGIEVEPLAEGLYRRLMICYQRLACPAEALGIYQRCHATLTSVLHIEPAPETKALYEDIRRSAM